MRDRRFSSPSTSSVSSADSSSTVSSLSRSDAITPFTEYSSLPTAATTPTRPENHGGDSTTSSSSNESLNRNADFAQKYGANLAGKFGGKKHSADKTEAHRNARNNRRRGASLDPNWGRKKPHPSDLRTRSLTDSDAVSPATSMTIEFATTTASRLQPNRPPLVHWDTIDDIDDSELSDDEPNSKAAKRRNSEIDFRPLGLLTIFVVMYMGLCALFFWRIDPALALVDFHRVLLFIFTTLTTIGYGDLVPTTDLSRTLILPMILCGTPLTFLFFNRLQHFIETLYFNFLDKYSPNKNRGRGFSMALILTLLVIYSSAGGVMFWDEKKSLSTAVYFCFISITTIGFGDYSPKPQSPWETAVVIAYLTVGLILMSTLVATLCAHLRRVHYLGRTLSTFREERRRKRRSADDPEAALRRPHVWLSGAKMSVAELVHCINNHYGTTSTQLKAMLTELNQILSVTQKQSKNSETARLVGADCCPDDAEPEFVSTFKTKEQHQQVLEALAALHQATHSGRRSFLNTQPSIGDLVRELKSSQGRS